MEIDTITFRHSGAEGEFCETFITSSDVYEVVLTHVNNTRSLQMRRMGSVPNLSNSAHSANVLTVTWKRISRKFLRIKVYEEDASKILLKKKVFKSFALSCSASFIPQDNRPLVYVIKINTYRNFAEVPHGIPQLQIEKSDNSKQTVKKDLDMLSTDIESLLENKICSDVTITDGENEMFVHKLILSARSSVFAKMFQHPMKENQQGVVKITDISFEVLQEFMHYLYSGTVKIDGMQMARDLFIAADKYDVQSLKNVCLVQLKSMSLDNVLDNLLLANLYGEQELKDAAFKFIAENYKEVRNLVHWGEFKIENKSLALETLNFVLEKKTNTFNKL